MTFVIADTYIVVHVLAIRVEQLLPAPVENTLLQVCLLSELAII